MAKLEWDKTGERFFETGVKNVVLYLYKEGATPDDPGEYTDGVAWNGVTAINEAPSGADATNLFADDAKYLVLRAAEEFGATIEAYTYPDEFSECNGEASIIPGVVIGQQVRKSFALCYRTAVGNDTDLDGHGYKLHFIYGATCSPSSRDYQTINDSPEALTFSWEMSTVPVPVVVGKGTSSEITYKPTATLVIDSTKFKTEAEVAKLKALEDILYGTSSTQPKLPLPGEIYDHFKAPAA